MHIKDEDAIKYEQLTNYLESMYEESVDGRYDVQDWQFEQDGQLYSFDIEVVICDNTVSEFVVKEAFVYCYDKDDWRELDTPTAISLFNNRKNDFVTSVINDKV